MNIAMAASTLPSDYPSGASYQAHYLANALVRMRHSVTMHSLSPRPMDALYDHRQLPRTPRATIWRYALALRQLDYRGFDALHCHGDDCFLGFKRRPRHVRTLHGASLAEAWNCSALGHKIRIAALALGEYVSLRVADLCVANSRSTMRYFPGVRAFIPCGVDLDTFHHGGVKSLHPTILFVGGMQGKKRGRLLLKTFQQHIRPRMPDAELWIVSGEPVDAEGVRYFGKVGTATLVSLYQSAWVFCMPSSYEGFGVPYVEAMACGTPVVATFNDGSREVLADGEYGTLCTDAELGDRLFGVLQDRDARENWVRQGTNRAQIYSWTRVGSQYIASYRGEWPEGAA
jgi:phosphatidylinositol alpha-mannosyltransferase